MNYQFLQNKVHLHLLGLMIGWVFFLLPAQAKDNAPSQQNVLTEYFNKLQATESPYPQSNYPTVFG